MDHANAPSASVATTPLDTQPAMTDVPNSPQSAAAPDQLALFRQAYLLEQLAAHDGASTSTRDLNAKITAPAKRQLQLTAKVANEVRSTLTEKGYLNATKSGRTVHYAITDAGRAYLTGLEKPSLSGRAKAVTTVDDAGTTEEIREAQNAYLLLQLLNADSGPVTKGDANKKERSLQDRLGLKPGIANFRRAKLAERGYIRIATAGKNEAYTLTSDGLEYLAAGARHLEHADFIVKGKALNALVTAARESPFQSGTPAAEPRSASARPDIATLEDAVLAEFENLLRRDAHRSSGLVPIHEVRQRIVARFGPETGGHDMLDEVILGLWRQQRLGLEGISDLGKATSDQLHDGIPGASGTLFYLEAPREQPVAP